MTPNEKTITAFETRLRQMILRFQELKRENEELYAMVEKNEQDIKLLQEKLEQRQNVKRMFQQDTTLRLK